MDGIITGKSYSSFTVNEVLLDKVVEAIRKGESDARRYSQVRSFEIYYNGLRSRMVFGRIMIVPAKLADSVEDFPSALLYGSVVREIRPEDMADLYTYKLGESEFDDYAANGLKEIKERLFKDADGVYRSIILFMPTWANVRDFVIFKMTRDFDLLKEMVRHQVYGAYYDPKFSSGFDHFSADTDNLRVSDITDKVNYPGLAENPAGRDEPALKAGDDGFTKMASSDKPIRLFAADTAVEIEEEFLEPGEKAVIDNLAAELKDKVEGGTDTPAEAIKTGGLSWNVSGEGNAWNWKITEGDLLGKQTRGQGTATSQAQAKQDLKRKLDEIKGYPKDASSKKSLVVPPAPALTPAAVVRTQPAAEVKPAMKFPLEVKVDAPKGKVEPALKLDKEFITIDPNSTDRPVGEALSKGAAVKTATPPGDHLFTEPGNGETIEDCPLPERERCNHVDSDQCAGGGYDSTCQCTTCHPQSGYAKNFQKKFDHKASTPVLTTQGHKLFVHQGSFVVVASGGYEETLRIIGNRPRFTRPLQFTASFRQGVEAYIRSPRRKQADVPLTFDSIWSDIAEDFGPAPVVNIKEPGKTSPATSESAPATESSAPKAEAAPQKPKLEKMHERRGEDADGKPNKIEESKPVIEAESDKAEKSEGKKPWEKDAATQPFSAPEGGGWKPWFDQIPEGEEMSAPYEEAPKPQADTPEFREWFGESKVVDESGNPRVCFHATASKSKAFQHVGRSFWAKLGQWFDTEPGPVHPYAQGAEPKDQSNLLPVYLRIENPKEFASLGDLKDAANGKFGPIPEARMAKLRMDLKKSGHDGVVIRNSSSEEPRDYWIAFDKDQMKSATGNSGAYAEGRGMIAALKPSCAVCQKLVAAADGSEIAPNLFAHRACQERSKFASQSMFIPKQVLAQFYPALAKYAGTLVHFDEVMKWAAEKGFIASGTEFDKLAASEQHVVLEASHRIVASQHSAAFDLFHPGQVLEAFEPELLGETVSYPSDNFTGYEHTSLDALPADGDKYVSTDPSAAMGIGRDGKSQVLDGAPLRQENDIRGYMFDQEYYSQQEGIDPAGFVAVASLALNKKAGVDENKAQFGDFLKRAMGEIAASFIAAFKVTSRAPMNYVPGTGELQLSQMEMQAMQPPPIGSSQPGSRVLYLVNKLTDSQIQEAINNASATASVFNEDPNGGYLYEVFVRPEAIDKQTLALKYSFVVGTKGL